MKLDYISQKITEKYADYISLFDKDMLYCEVSANEYMKEIFKGIDPRKQEQIMEKVKIVHNLLFSDIKDYSFITTGDTYRKIADATHAYKDPMIAYDYMRKANAAYYYNISTPDRTNKKYRMGWLNRSALSYTPYGLYVPTTIDVKSVGLQYSSSFQKFHSH